MKKILVIKDPKMEVGFDVVCNYAAEIQKRVGGDTVVVPIWPHGRIDLIDDKNEIKVIVKNLENIQRELKDMLAKKESKND